MVFPFGAFAPDGRESGHQWHSRDSGFDPHRLHHEKESLLNLHSATTPFLMWKILYYWQRLKTHNDLTLVFGKYPVSINSV